MRQEGFNFQVLFVLAQYWSPSAFSLLDCKISPNQHSIVLNYFGPKDASFFVMPLRKNKKNKKSPGVEYQEQAVKYKEFQQKSLFGNSLSWKLPYLTLKISIAMIYQREERDVDRIPFRKDKLDQK